VFTLQLVGLRTAQKKKKKKKNFKKKKKKKKKKIGLILIKKPHT